MKAPSDADFRKRITYVQDADGLWTSTWETSDGNPVSHRDLNQLKRVTMVGFRRQQADYRRARMAQQNA